METLYWPLIFVLSGVIFFFITYIYYIACTSLQRRYGKTAPGWAKAVVYIFVIFFDTPMNLLWITVWFVDIPREFTVTARMKRWRKKYEGQRFNRLNWFEQRRLLFAIKLCDEHLDYYDVTGDHC